MRRKRGPKRRKINVQRTSKPKPKTRKRPRRDRVCPVHGRALVPKPHANTPSWRCPEPGCDMRRGDGPTSTPCDAATGRARMLLHDSFDPLWQPGTNRKFMYRNRAYQWLAGALGLSVRQYHIGYFTKEMCARAQEAINELLKGK